MSTRTIILVRTPARVAPFQIDFPKSVLDVNGRPCDGSSVHFSAGSQYELSPEQIAYVRKNEKKLAPLLVEVLKREREITAPPASFGGGK